MISRFSAAFAMALLASASIAAETAAKPAAAPAPATTSTPPDTTNFPSRVQTVPLYGDAAIPNSRPGPDEESSANGSWIRKVSRPFIQVYLPARSKANGAGVVIFPGGGYAGLTYDFEGTQQANYFIDHGIAAFVVKYRIPSDRTMVDKSMGPLMDAQQAMRFARQHAAEWNLDPKRMGVIGFSAGGHLASTLATHFDKPYVDNPDQVDLRPSFLVLVYPVISMDEKITHMDSRKALLGATPSRESTSILTSASPWFTNPSFSAADLERSITRFSTYGPRSLITTSTSSLLARLVTFTRVPKGRLLCAAVSLPCLYFSPLAVGLPSNLSA